MAKEKIIIGVDPGTVEMGYGIISVTGSQLSLVTMGLIKLSKYDDHAIRLQQIFKRIVSLIDEFHPDELAIEAPFYGKNVQSMLKLGRAQGVAIAASLSRDLPYVEYAPKRVKQAVTGNGNSSKHQVNAMVSTILSVKAEMESLDVSDALAVAICHHFQSSNKLGGGKKYSGWSSFVKNNPNLKIN